MEDIQNIKADPLFTNTSSQVNCKKRLDKLKYLFQEENTEVDNPYDHRALFRHFNKQEDNEIVEIKNERKDYFEPYKEMERILIGIEKKKEPLKFKDYIDYGYDEKKVRDRVINGFEQIDKEVNPYDSRNYQRN